MLAWVISTHACQYRRQQPVQQNATCLVWEAGFQSPPTATYLHTRSGLLWGVDAALPHCVHRTAWPANVLEAVCSSWNHQEV